MRTTTLTIQTTTGPIALEVHDNPLSLEVAQSILEGKTYPAITFVKDVETIADIGANVGAASVCFALRNPAAKVYSFEPYPDTCRLLRRNVASLPNIRVFECGLFDRDCHTSLFLSREDSVTNSIGTSYLNGKQSVAITLWNAADFFRRESIDHIDILKIDTEGCELPILHSLSGMLKRIKVIYLEYHDEADRLAIDNLLRSSHILTAANLRHPHRGELCYVSYEAFPSAEGLDRMRIRQGSHEAASQAPLASVKDSLPMILKPRSQDAQQFQVAVVIPTILRSTLMEAVESVFAQRIDGPAQLLIGVDCPLGDPQILEEIQSRKPDNWHLSVFDPGYSTSVRHGGFHAAKDGGALRTILSYTANSRYVAYLDDDNAWSPDHLPSLLDAIRGFDWAYSHRWFADSETLEPLCEDTWESVGIGKGIFSDRLDGFVDPNTLLIDKLVCESVLPWWSIPFPDDAKGMSADRNVFQMLKSRYRGKGTLKATCYYRLDSRDDLHAMRLERIGQARPASDS
jgi:FkbM family methyltransferase